MRSSIIVIMLTVLTLLVACGNKGGESQTNDKTKKFSIEGKFENGVGKSLYLQKSGRRILFHWILQLLIKRGILLFITPPQFLNFSL